MQFKEAAYVVLKKSDIPLHYKEITSKALQKSLLETVGRTPEATMAALLYTDTLKPDSRFIRASKPGTFALKSTYAPGIQRQIENVNTTFRKDLKNYLHKLSAQKFEELILRLLEAMGFEETEQTGLVNDKGIDIRGILRSNPLSVVKVAVQAKRWKQNVGSGVVRNLRGSLLIADAEQGIIITPSDFTPTAKGEANAPGKTPIQLINGDQLVDLLIEYHVGVKNEEYTIPVIDADYWKEVLNINILEQDASKDKSNKQPQKPTIKDKVEFPLDIRAKYRGTNYSARLLSLEGSIELNGKIYKTPSEAAKTITIYWKSVNGWDFWHYLDPETGKLEKIGTLRNK